MTKPDKIDLIVQLFLAQWVLGTLETPFPAFGKISGVPCSKPVLADDTIGICTFIKQFHCTTKYLHMMGMTIIIMIIVIIIIIITIISIIITIIIIILKLDFQYHQKGFMEDCPDGRMDREKMRVMFAAIMPKVVK